MKTSTHYATATLGALKLHARRLVRAGCSIRQTLLADHYLLSALLSVVLFLLGLPLWL